MFAFCSFNTRPLWPLVVQLRNIPLRFQPIYVCNRNSGNGIRPLAAPSPFLTFSDTYARRHLKKSIWCVQRLWMGKAPNHCLNRIDRIDETTNLISGICRSCFHATLACNQTRWHPQMWSLAAAAAATTTQLRQSLSISVIFSQWFADGHVIGASKRRRSRSVLRKKPLQAKYLITVSIPAGGFERSRTIFHAVVDSLSRTLASSFSQAAMKGCRGARNFFIFPKLM